MAITWITAATPDYAADLERLARSFPLAGPGHELRVVRLPPRRGWCGAVKFDALEREALASSAAHVAWIDADCEVLGPLPVELLTGGPPLFAVRHLGFGRPSRHTPAWYRPFIHRDADLWRQSCFFGGERPWVLELVRAAREISAPGEVNDENGLNCVWDRLGPGVVRTLGCEYAAPSQWGNIPPGFRRTYEGRREGASLILHHNRWNHPK